MNTILKKIYLTINSIIIFISSYIFALNKFKHITSISNQVIFQNLNDLIINGSFKDKGLGILIVLWYSIPMFGVLIVMDYSIKRIVGENKQYINYFLLAILIILSCLTVIK